MSQVMATTEDILASSPDNLVEVKHLVKHFPVTGGFFKRQVGVVHAVDDVSFNIKKKETFGLVGESGCGKTTTGRVLLRLEKATSGEVLFDGKNVLSMSQGELRTLRREMQIVFQDPYGSLNPRMNVRDIISEPLIVHHVASGPEIQKRVEQLLEVVGLAKSHASRYPHEFSGGQRQRIGIARALALNPKLVVADEPVSALDVSIQSQILTLLENLQKEFGLTYLVIAHGLNVVKYISDRVGVMYLGKMVEIGTSQELFGNPQHPYTEALMSAIPIPNPELKRERIILQGDVPSPINPPAGCRFHTRCPYAFDRCKVEEPPLIQVRPNHWVACHLRTAEEAS